MVVKVERAPERRSGMNDGRGDDAPARHRTRRREVRYVPHLAPWATRDLNESPDGRRRRGGYRKPMVITLSNGMTVTLPAEGRDQHLVRPRYDPRFRTVTRTAP